MKHLIKRIYPNPGGNRSRLTLDNYVKNKPNYYDFDNEYIHIKALFVNEFKKMPNEYFTRNIDGEAFYQFIKQEYGDLIKESYQRVFYNWTENKEVLDHNILILSNEVILHIEPNFVEILYSNVSVPFGEGLREKVITFKALDKEKDFEINIITRESHGLDIKTMDINPTSLNLNLFYNDDFIPIHELIQKRLNQENDKGIVLLHGLPGTGKTTYIRHLIGSIKKKVLFVSPAVANDIMNPEFIDLLIDNPNSLLIIEDAENIIMDRRYQANSSVSNLLNISDGLLSDFLNVQLLCTFNSELSFVDQALLRKGRLIAKYEFGKLSRQKSRALSTHLGFDRDIETEMTLTEIANQNESTNEVKETYSIGFRRESQ